MSSLKTCLIKDSFHKMSLFAKHIRYHGLILIDSYSKMKRLIEWLNQNTSFVEYNDYVIENKFNYTHFTKNLFVTFTPALNVDNSPFQNVNRIGVRIKMILNTLDCWQSSHVSRKGARYLEKCFIYDGLVDCSCF
jgi:hypothetical protein